MTNRKDKAQEKEFQDFLLSSSITQIKIGMWATLALFVLFRTTTLVLFGDSPMNQFFLRFGAIVPFIIATLIVLYIPLALKQLRRLLIIIILLSAPAVFLVGALSTNGEPGYEFYSHWVMLVIMGTSVFYRIKSRIVQGVVATIIFSYILANIYNHSFSDNPLYTTVQLFFVLAISILGVFITNYRRKANYKIFLQKKALDEQNESLINEIHEKENIQKALKESEAHYRNIMDTLPDIVYVLDKDLRFIMINHSLRERNAKAGITQDITGKHLQEVYPFLGSERLKELEEVLKSGKIQVRESSQVIFNETVYLETRSIPVFRNDEPAEVLVIVRDISDKIEVEKLKQKNLQQKEILLREIHHRVKNNLAIVISLMDMQIRNNPNREFIEMTREIEYRIRSMAMIHEHLYKSEELDRIPFDKYLSAITAGVTRCYANNYVKTVFDVENIDVKIETAMPLGLIVNEILTNACKHAFPKKKEGEITIILKHEYPGEDLFRLTIKDNGIGLPPGFSLDTPINMGLYIIKLLTEQISAKLILENHQGTSFSLIFKNPPRDT